MAEEKFRKAFESLASVDGFMPTKQLKVERITKPAVVFDKTGKYVGFISKCERMRRIELNDDLGFVLSDDLCA